MAKIKIHPTDPTMYMYWDVATDEANAFCIMPGRGWNWNGDFEKPTVRPSVLNTISCRVMPSGERLPDFRNHVFITDGKIQYLSDCTHHLAGKTVDMVDFPEDW